MTLTKLHNMTDTIDNVTDMESGITDKVNKEYEATGKCTSIFLDTIACRLRSLKDKTLEKLESIESSMVQMADLNLTNLQSDEAVVAQNLQALKSETASDTDLFIDMILAQRKTAEIRDRLSAISHKAPKLCMKVSVNPYIMDIVEQVPLLGDYETVSGIGIRNISDTGYCSITDMCQISDGSFLLCDIGNQKIKRFMFPDGVTSSVLVQPAPESLHICDARKNRAVVAIMFCGNTMKSTIQSVVVHGNEIIFQKSFTVNSQCLGLMRHKRQLYICCSKDQFGPAAVKVYSKKGVLLRCISQEFTGTPLFAKPLSICRSWFGQSLLVGDAKFGVIKLDLHENTGKVVPITKVLGFSNCGLTVDDRNNLYMCSKESERLMQVSIMKSRLNELSTLDVSGITSLCYDGVRNRLLVTCRSTDMVHVYTIPH